jgi:DNA modification methylase
VLKDDGTVWLNLGDSYYNADKWGGGGGNVGKHTVASDGSVPSWAVRERKPLCRCEPGACGLHPGLSTCSLRDLKPKDLVGIPWRVAFALQAAGWYLRSDIIWAKPNPMPESVTDRPTRSHEYLFLFTKREQYYYDHMAVKEPAVSTKARKFTDGGRDKQRGHGRRHAGFNGRYAEKVLAAGVPLTRNRRSVWTIATRPYAEAHFATFPPALVEPCLLAGSADWEIDHTRSVVLDPFCGSGTVGLVAAKHGRFFLGLDLSLPYLKLAQRRLA